MERLWCGEARMKYPKQWLIMVNLENEAQTNKVFGDVYLITPDKDEAYEKAISLGGTMGRKIVIAGFDDTPQIGGFEICCQY